jgi:tRNA(Ile2) C34 agmatinyltransferase TiaS
MAEEIAGKPSGNPRIDFLTKENRRKVVNTMDEGLRRRGERNKTQKLIAKSGGLDPAKHATDRLNWFKD